MSTRPRVKSTPQFKQIAAAMRHWPAEALVRVSHAERWCALSLARDNGERCLIGHAEDCVREGEFGTVRVRSPLPACNDLHRPAGRWDDLFEDYGAKAVSAVREEARRLLDQHGGLTETAE